jgi:hypothetical protein
MVELRGYGPASVPAYDRVYFSARVPVRQATVLEGHAVRALYLAAGATDVASETGDASLLEALERQWENTVAAKTYLTGGLGSRWDGEAFGDPYELPNDRAYAETCAAIASVQWSWRLLLATGRPRYAELIEQTLYNAVLPGVSLDGRRFFYANALQVRTGAVASSSIDPARGRQPWFSTACCPPNLMRTFASLPHYLASQTDDGLQVHQYASGELTAALAAGTLAVTVRTDYPDDGQVLLTVRQAPAEAASISVRVPGWAEGARLTGPDGSQELRPGYRQVSRTWRAGDQLELRLPMQVRVRRPDPRNDAARGCIALERGPLVYCLEQLDQPVGLDLDLLTVDPAWLPDSVTEQRCEELDGAVALRFPGDAGAELMAVPYGWWANRSVGAMRVWLPARAGSAP